MKPPAASDRSGSSSPDLTELVQLFRTLGEPWRRFAILAEGNTSQRLGEDGLAVEATGRSLRDAGVEDFVQVSLRRLSELVDDPAAGNADVAAYFDEVEAGQGARPSVKALLHVVCVLDCGATTAAHTHPESVNALLCTTRRPSSPSSRCSPTESWWWSAGHCWCPRPTRVWSWPGRSVLSPAARHPHADQAAA